MSGCKDSSCALPLSHTHIPLQVQTIPAFPRFPAVALQTSSKQFIKWNFSGINAEPRIDLRMNHDNVSYCLCSNEDYQDGWRETNHPLDSSQTHSALLFLMLGDLLVITAANKPS